MADRARRVRVWAILPVLVWLSTAATADGQTVTGTLTVNGTVTSFGNVYALAHTSPLDKSKEDVTVILASGPVPDELLFDEIERMKAGAAGTIQMVEVTIGANGRPLDGVIYQPAFRNPVAVSGMHKFEPAVFDEATIGGKLFIDGPRSFQGITYQYSASFKVSIQRKAGPSDSDLAAYANSQQTQAVFRYLEAVRTGDVAAIKAALTPDMAKELEGPDSTQILELLKVMTPTHPTVANLTVKGDSATLTLEEREGTSTTMLKVNLRLVDGEWKISR